RQGLAPGPCCSIGGLTHDADHANPRVAPGGTPARYAGLAIEALEKHLALSPTLPLPPPHVPSPALDFLPSPPPTPAPAMGALARAGSVVTIMEPPDPCSTVGPRFAPPDPCFSLGP